MKLIIACHPEELNKIVLNDDLKVSYLSEAWDIPKEIKENGIYLFGKRLRYHFRDELVKLESCLNRERAENNHTWAPLSLRYIYPTLLHYQQFLVRLEEIIKEQKITEIFLTSKWDSYLVFACQTLSEKHGLKFTSENGKFEIYSCLDSFYPYHDIYKKGNVNHSLVTYILKIIFRPGKYKFFYQDYWNSDLSNGFKIKYAHFFFFDKLFSYFSKKNRGAKLLFEEKMFHDLKKEAIVLNRKNWQEFSDEDFLIINFLFKSFFILTPEEYLNSLERQLNIFFSGVTPGKKFILNDPLNPFSRLLNYVMRKKGVDTQFLPHGLTPEFYYFSESESLFNQSEILAWNKEGVKCFQKNNVNVSFFENSYFKKMTLLNLRKYDFQKMEKILLLVQSPDSYNIDALECSVLQVALVMTQFPALQVDVKVHNSFPEVENIRSRHLNNLLNRFNQLKHLKTTKRVIDLCKEYELVIIGGQTTAILECASRRVPFLIYRPDNIMSVFNLDLHQVIAQNPDELLVKMNLLQEIDFDRVFNLIIDDFFTFESLR